MPEKGRRGSQLVPPSMNTPTPNIATSTSTTTTITFYKIGKREKNNQSKKLYAADWDFKLKANNNSCSRSRI